MLLIIINLLFLEVLNAVMLLKTKEHIKAKYG